PSWGMPDLSSVAGRGYGPDAAPSWEPLPGRPLEPAHALDFLFGTDLQGRSVLWRVLYGARVSLTIALGASILSLAIGTALGAIAGYFGGLADVLITWLFTTMASIPRILLVLAMAYAMRDVDFAALGISPSSDWTGIVMLIVAMGLTTWVTVCRLIRGEVMKQRSMDYEAAARAIGMSRGRVLVRHLLPNVFYLVIIQFSLLFPLFIHLEVILSYLGLGPSADTSVSWGQMIQASLQELMRSPVVWWQLATATVAVFGISLALNLFGDALRDALDPRVQGR
ncbi:MAG: ABC transporter permease, partial [Phycisphaerales bacterium]|nr:ABC transporter permease [Phycisphaerales bacterium]